MREVKTKKLMNTIAKQYDFAGKCLRTIIKIVNKQPNHTLEFSEAHDIPDVLVWNESINNVEEVAITKLVTDENGLSMFDADGEEYWPDEVCYSSVVYPNLLQIIYQNTGAL